jgi:hypothetical protein
MGRRRGPTSRELRTQAILRSDRTLLTMTAAALSWIGNAVAILWLILLVIVIANNAGDGQVLVGLAAIPVLLFWVIARSAPRLVRWVTKDYP